VGRCQKSNSISVMILYWRSLLWDKKSNSISVMILYWRSLLWDTKVEKLSNGVTKTEKSTYFNQRHDSVAGLRSQKDRRFKIF
jgi:hypothetical protein